MANTWNQANTTWGQNTWGKQSDVTLTLTGQSSTATVGSLTELIEVKPGWGTLKWGENGWGSVESATETLIGLSATTSLGTLTEIPGQIVGLTGIEAETDLGSLTSDASLTLSLTGRQLTSSFGNVSLDEHSVGLVGLSATSSVGTLNPADVIGITGRSAETDLGTLGFTSDPLITLSGQMLQLL